MRACSIPELEGVSWDDVSLVARVSEAGGFRKAAQDLGAAASTVLRQIDRLEARLGTRLFERVPSGLVLNAAGRTVLEIGRDMERQFARLRQVAQLDAKASGEVRIAVPDVLSTFWLSPRLPQFLAQSDIQLQLDDQADGRRLLTSEIDIAVQLVKPQQADLIASKLCRLHLYPYASLRYIESRGLPQRDGPKARHQMVACAGKTDEAAELNPVLKEICGGRRPALTTNSSMAHLQAIEAGLGVGELPIFAMAAGPHLIPVDIGAERYLDVWIAYRSEMRHIKRISIVIDWLREMLSPRRYPWFRPEFMHPADVAVLVADASGSAVGLGSRYWRDQVSGEAPRLTDYRRGPGRPPVARPVGRAA